MSFNFGSGPRVEDPKTLLFIGICAVVIVCLVFLCLLVEALKYIYPQKKKQNNGCTKFRGQLNSYEPIYDAIMA